MNLLYHVPGPNRHLNAILHSAATRPLRFAVTGLAAAALQLILLLAMTHYGWDALAANIIAFLLAAQLNFALSSTLTWSDRRDSHSPFRRWLFFHASISTTVLLNTMVFALARPLVPALAASCLGIAAGAIGNYLAGDRIVFRRSRSPQLVQAGREKAA